MEFQRFKLHLFFLILLLLLSITNQALAHEKSRFMFNLYGGISSSNFNKSDLALSTTENDTLHETNSTTDFTGGLGLAYDFYKPSILGNPCTYWLHDIALGLDLFFLNTASKGLVYQFNDANAANYNYNLAFRTARLMVDSIFGLKDWQGFVPFIKLSLGAARINAKYYETPRLSEGVTNGQLSLPSKTTTNITYSAGIGLKKMLASHVQLSAFYLFTDFGSVDTATQSSNNINLQKPISTRLKNNAGLLELSFLF